MANEHRVSLSFDGKSIQDFGEKYFSGHFTFEINVSRCTAEQLGLLIQSVLRIEKLGRGYNAGYGRIEVKAIQLVDRQITRSLVWNDTKFQVVKQVTEDPLEQEVREA
ncbi:MAG: hypothetical protein ACFFBD_20730, partial [Candidatus Hodarchaeota archaeon]